MSLVGKAMRMTNRRGDPVVIKSLLLDKIGTIKVADSKDDKKE